MVLPQPEGPSTAQASPRPARPGEILEDRRGVRVGVSERVELDHGYVYGARHFQSA